MDDSGEISNVKILKEIYPDWQKYLEVYINEPSINKKVRQINYLTSTLKGDNKVAWLLKAISFIDLTTLNGDDTNSNVRQLCEKAANPMSFYEIPFNWNKPLHTAAVCVYPSRVNDAITALKELNKTNVIKVASVAAGFPSGLYPLETRLQEVQYAIEYGAEEIDIVIDRSLVLNHDWYKLCDEISAVRKICDQKKGKRICLKVILSTGEMFNLKDVYKASIVAIFGGADFIKTSTGKEAINATLYAGIVMCRAIKECYRLFNIKIGIKPAGGIKKAKDVLQWMVLIKEELGNEWLENSHFRIGASSVLESIANEIVITYK